jgi:hypothetical protein
MEYKQVTSNRSKVKLGTGQGSSFIYTATRVTQTGRKDSDGTPIFTREIIRYPNATSEENEGVVIATGSNEDGASNLSPTANITNEEKRNLNNRINPASKTQITSVQNQLDSSSESQESLADLGGTDRNPNPEDQSNTSTPTGLGGLNANQVKGTGRKLFSQGLRYPLELGGTQDVVKFTMLEYRPQSFSNEEFGFSSRPRDIGNGIGSVILPVPAGIRDSNGAEWGGQNMNAFQAAMVNLASNTIQEGASGAENVAKNIAGKIPGASEELKQAVIQTFTAQATGVQGILARTQGAVINPNMELLFSGPTLRSFTFTYKLSARSKPEADRIIQIIRFFKQGMSPQKSESNIFLKAPHTFQVQYLLKGEGEHPYIGKMKECALQNFSVNYTPENNYATYEDGFMVSYEISMQMQELEPVYNNDYTDLDNNADSQIGF